MVVTVQDIVFQLQRLITAMAKYYTECHSVLKDTQVFPIEVDLSHSTFTYDTSQQFNDVADDEEAAEETGEEVKDTEGWGKGGAGDVALGNLVNTS